MRRLQDAEVVLYDHLVDASILELCKHAVKVFVGKVPDGPATPQEQINEMLFGYARQGLRVVRLKGGDAFVFGRGAEEAVYLGDRGVSVDVVPGVSSSIGVPASVGIPVTHRGVSTHFTVVTGTAAEQENLGETWARIAAAGGTIVFLMGVRALPQIVHALRTGGLAADTPIALIENGTTARERVTYATLESAVAVAHASRIASPATIVVGEVVRIREHVLLQAPLSALPAALEA